MKYIVFIAVSIPMFLSCSTDFRSQTDSSCLDLIPRIGFQGKLELGKQFDKCLDFTSEEPFHAWSSNHPCNPNRHYESWYFQSCGIEVSVTNGIINSIRVWLERPDLAGIQLKQLNVHPYRGLFRGAALSSIHDIGFSENSFDCLNPTNSLIRQISPDISFVTYSPDLVSIVKHEEGVSFDCRKCGTISSILIWEL
jgi:hypothetical protein